MNTKYQMGRLAIEKRGRQRKWDGRLFQSETDRKERTTDEGLEVDELGGSGECIADPRGVRFRKRNRDEIPTLRAYQCYAACLYPCNTMTVPIWHQSQVQAEPEWQFEGGTASYLDGKARKSGSRRVYCGRRVEACIALVVALQVSEVRDVAVECTGQSLSGVFRSAPRAARRPGWTRIEHT